MFVLLVKDTLKKGFFTVSGFVFPQIYSYICNEQVIIILTPLTFCCFSKTTDQLCVETVFFPKQDFYPIIRSMLGSVGMSV